MQELVRDKMPELMISQGKKIEMRLANSREYELMLWKMLQDKSKEFMLNTKDEELADVLEVLHCIADLKNISWEGAEDFRMKKNEARGSFKKKIIVEKVQPRD